MRPSPHPVTQALLKRVVEGRQEHRTFPSPPTDLPTDRGGSRNKAVILVWKFERGSE